MEYFFELNNETDLVSTNDYPDPDPSIPVSAQEFAENTAGYVESNKIVYPNPPVFTQLRGFPPNSEDYLMSRQQRN